MYIYVLYYSANTINRMGRKIFSDSNNSFPSHPKMTRHFVAKHYKIFFNHGVTFFPTRLLPKFQGSLRKINPKICGIFLSIPK